MKGVFGLLGLVLAQGAWAAPLELKYGVNEVDVNADGVKDMIMKVRWENISAHAYDKYLVIVRQGDKFHEATLGSVPDKFFRTAEGAECQTAGYVFSKAKDGMLQVTAYSREVGESYPEPMPVKVTHYKLAAEELVPGMYYLREGNTYTTKEKHCDVRDVMR